MVSTPEDLERFLQKLERRFERLDEATFLIALGADHPPLALRLAAPVLVVQAPIGKAPSKDAEREAALFRKLLEYNASDLLHCAYGLEADDIVLSAALELETLDLNELEAVLADVDMALGEQVPVLRQMAPTQARG
jgi:hypothetical protein